MTLPSTPHPSSEERTIWVCPECGLSEMDHGGTITCAGIVAIGTDHEPTRMESVGTVPLSSLTQAQQELEQAVQERRNWADHCTKAERQRDELREALGDARVCLQQMVDWFGENDSRADDFGRLNFVADAQDKILPTLNPKEEPDDG